MSKITPITNFTIVLRHLFLKFKEEILYLKVGSFWWRSTTSGFQSYIKRLSFISRAGFASSTALFIISLLIIFPIYYKTNLAEAAGSLSDTTLSITSDNLTARVDLLVTSDSGTFASTASGSEMSFNVTTNNATGYMLSISAKSGTDLTNSTAGTSFTSLDATNSTTAAGITADTFGNASNTVYNNQWGFKPNYYKSSANSDKFYPSPTTAGVILNKTSAANTAGASETYTIAIGARATYAQVAGTYTNTYILSAVGNYPQYKITYVDNTSDSTLNNMPSPNPQTTPSATGTTIKLSTTKPTRTGYTFAGWCTVDNSANTSACSGTTYAAEAEFPLSTLSANNVNLYAVWTANKYPCTKQYRLQGTNASYPTSYTTDTTEQVDYSATCSYSKSQTGFTTQSTSGTMNSTSGITLQVSLPRTEYSVKVNFAGSGVSSISFAASGWNTRTVSTSGNTASLAYDVQYTMTTNFNSGYEMNRYILNNINYGAMVSIQNGSSTTNSTANPSWFTPNNRSSSAIITVTGKSTKCKPTGTTVTTIGCMQDITSSNKSTVLNSMAIGTQYQLYDARDEKQYYVARLSDGNIWMTQNLDYSITANDVTSGLTSETTDLTSYGSGAYTNGYSKSGDIITWKPARATINATSVTNNSISGWSNDNRNPYSVDPGDWYWMGATFYDSIVCNYLNGCTDKFTKNATTNTNGEHGHVGNYYNWSAAVASNNTSSLTSSTYASPSSNPQNSICPAGWRLPTISDASNSTSGSTNEFSRLNYLYNSDSTSTSQNLEKSPLYFVRAGDINTGRLDASGYSGYYLSSTVRSNSNAYYLQLDSKYVHFAASDFARNLGFSVRCVAR